jgi:CheY-like chemotaxis protein
MEQQSCKVLVVDDNHDAADAAVILLGIWGHEALAAYSPAECIAVASAFDPDVVLMDIAMPGKDGFEVTRELKESCPGVKVVALTGYTQADIVRRSRVDGFEEFLRKPVEASELKNVVDKQCAAAKS